MTLGEKIQEQRKLKGLTQDELAEKLGVTAQAVSKWERGTSMPDVALLPEIANIFGITIDSLFSNEKEPEVQMVPVENRKKIDEMYLRVNVVDGGDKIKVNVPLSLLIVCLEVGIPVENMVSVGDAKVDMSKIDLKKIIDLAERGIIGKIVEIEGEDGENIVVEVC